MSTEAKPFTGWISVESGLVNLSHAVRIQLHEVESTFMLAADFDDGEQVSLAVADSREVAEKALRYLAANLKAIYAVRS
jgi:hypothetical protein